MTKISKKSILLVTIFVIGFLILSRIYLANKVSNTDALLVDYTQRQQELLNQQHQLQDMIIDLNKTLQSEISTQKDLSSQLASITGQSTTSSGSSTTPLPNTPPQTTTTTTPVTRAS